MALEGSDVGYEWAQTEGIVPWALPFAAASALLLAEWYLDRRNTAHPL